MYVVSPARYSFHTCMGLCRSSCDISRSMASVDVKCKHDVFATRMSRAVTLNHFDLNMKPFKHIEELVPEGRKCLCIAKALTTFWL